LIEDGKRADFVMLEAGALRGFPRTAGIAGVMLKGKWLDKVG
jgi:hypothetical protein